MGKQIRFFQMEDDEVTFLKFVEQSGDYVVTTRGEKLNLKDILTKNDFQIYIVQNDKNIFLGPNGFLDTEKSEIIEYSRCEKSRNNQIYYGRIWAEFKYYSNGEFIVKTRSFVDKYNHYKSWIKANMNISKCKKFYIGSEALKYYNQYKWHMMATPVTKIEF